MEHRGVRYAIRIGFQREQWRVAIYPSGNGLSKEKTVFGTRQDAEVTARSMINAWLKKRSALRSRTERSAANGQID
jgi:pyruvoyl-dependent arginine decarboxylase (PvlArgDC)